SADGGTGGEGDLNAVAGVAQAGGAARVRADKVAPNEHARGDGGLAGDRIDEDSVAGVGGDRVTQHLRVGAVHDQSAGAVVVDAVGLDGAAERAGFGPDHDANERISEDTVALDQLVLPRAEDAVGPAVGDDVVQDRHVGGIVVNIHGRKRP